MVFSSIPAYLDTSNWHQHPNHQLIGSSSTNPLLPPPPHSGPPAPPPPPPHGSVGAGSIRPGSMAERARMANIPLPEAALKCPRCESTNTKFCYFNNYSLSQPRHFCKTCRRYWTRGGALRNVPVGGGCRRNKRSKSGGGSSKSPASSGDRQNNNNTNPTATTTTPASTATSTLLGLTSQLLQPLRFMSPLSQITDHFNTDNMGLSYSGITAPLLGNNDINFHGGNPFQAGGVTSLLSAGGGAGGGGGIEAWRMQQVQQFPYFSSLDPSQQVGMYQFQGGESAFMGGVEMRPRLNACVKMEESHPHHLNLSRQMMAGGNGIQGNEHWNGTNTWTELSSFSSSSTSNPL